jgi:DNA-binding response OmpR family regulator
MRQGPAIALVNDCEYFLRLTGTLLERRGYRPASYPATEQTYADLLRDQPDLIIVSIASERPVPVWNLLTLLRLDRATAAIPLLLTSPDSELLGRKQGHLGKVGCDLLEEPFTEQQLLAKVQGTFSRLVVWDHDL